MALDWAKNQRMDELVVAHYDNISCFKNSLSIDTFYLQGDEEDVHQSPGPEDEGHEPEHDVPAGVEAHSDDIVMEETLCGRTNPKDIFQWSKADILKLSEDLLYKIQEQRSREDTGGVDREQMVRLGGLFMERAFDIVVSRSSFLVDTDGDCLSNTLSYISNPKQTKEMTTEGGTGLRQVVVGEVLEFIREASMEALQPIQVAAAASSANLGEWLTRDQLLTRLATYRNNGTWAGDLGDLMPQLYASFTNTPIFVIVYDSKGKRMIGYFINPDHIFNRPTLRTAASPVMLFQKHYEPLVVPDGFMEAWEAICASHETEELTMAAIQVQLSEEDLMGVRGERRGGRGATAATAGGRSGGDVSQRQPGQYDWGSLAGD